MIGPVINGYFTLFPKREGKGTLPGDVYRQRNNCCCTWNVILRMAKRGLKWEAAVPARTRDNLVSSPTFRHIKPFTPSYEKDDSYNMYYVLGWEYGRIWFAEIRKFEKLMYGKESKGAGDLFKRGVLIKKPIKK